MVNICKSNIAFSIFNIQIHSTLLSTAITIKIDLSTQMLKNEHQLNGWRIEAVTPVMHYQKPPQSKAERSQACAGVKAKSRNRS